MLSLATSRHGVRSGHIWHPDHGQRNRGGRARSEDEVVLMQVEAGDAGEGQEVAAAQVGQRIEARLDGVAQHVGEAAQQAVPGHPMAELGRVLVSAGESLQVNFG